MVGKPLIKIFIASSAELKAERERGILLINQLNNSHKHLQLKPVAWEYDMVYSNYPGHKDIQEAINPKLEESQLAVFIFYSKIGKYTRQEFNYAVNNKRCLAYFKTGFSPKKEQIQSYGELLELKEGLNDSLLYKDFDDIDGFEKLLYANLNLYLSENHSPHVDQEEKLSISALSQTNLVLIQSLALKDKEISELRASQLLPDPATNQRLEKLFREKEAIENELNQSKEMRAQLVKDKEDLEAQLGQQKEQSVLKAMALEEVEKGDYAAAEQHLRDSARDSIKETAATFYELGKIKKLQFQYKEALGFFELSIKIEPGNSPCLNEAGIMAYNMGYYDKAIKNYEAALEIDKNILGEERADIAVLYSNLGLAFNSMGDYDKAIEYCQKALKIDEKLHDANDPTISSRYNNLGSAFDSNGQYDMAIEYYQKALQIDKIFKGAEHLNIATRYNNLGLAYGHKGEYDTAIEYYQKALKIDKKFHGGKHPTIAILYNNLGLAYVNKAEYDMAIEYHQLALQIDKKFHGEEHPDIATDYNSLGVLYHRKGEYNIAIKYYQKASLILKKFLSPNHPKLKTAERNLAIAQEDFDKSKS